MKINKYQVRAQFTKSSSWHTLVLSPDKDLWDTYSHRVLCCFFKMVDCIKIYFIKRPSENTPSNALEIKLETSPSFIFSRNLRIHFTWECSCSAPHGRESLGLCMTRRRGPMWSALPLHSLHCAGWVVRWKENLSHSEPLITLPTKVWQV